MTKISGDNFELRIVNPSTGLADTVLPDFQTFTLSPVISDAGTVQFTYPRNGHNYSAIQMDLDLAVFFNGVELGYLRSTMEQRTWDDANPGEEGDVASITCRTSLARMQRAVVYPQGWPDNTDPPSYAFTAATPGVILRTLVELAQLRGTIPEIDISSFSDTNDSNGVPWAQTISMTWDAQYDYLQVINDLYTYGQCEAVMDVYSLHLYNYQTLGSDLTVVDPPVVIRKARDLTQSSVQESTRDLRTVVLASGSNNLYVESESEGAVLLKGRRETGTSASGITDATQLQQIGDTFAVSVSNDIIARTNALVFDDGSPVPGTDFDLGDWVWTSIDGTLFRQRTIQWSLSCDGTGVITGTSAMDNIFGEFLTRLQAQVNAIENGMTITGGSDPTSVTVINSPPRKPGTVSAGTSAYLDNQGHTYSAITVVWSAVTEDQNGAADPNIAGYQVRLAFHGTTTWSTVTTDNNTLSYYFGSLLPSTQFDYQVQCFDNQSNYSGWSTVQTVTTASDTTPPNTPSTPVVASTLGQLSITWDGKDSLGANMPGDFDHLSVYVSSSSPTFTPSPANLYQNMRGGGTVTVPGAVLTYGTTYYVRFIAYDQSGNASVASTAGSATLSQVVSTDIESGQVSLSNLSFSDVGNLIDNGSFEDPNWRAVRNTAFGGTHFALDNTTSSSGIWSVVHTGTAGQVDESVNLATVNCTPGQTFMGAADWKVSSAVTSTMRVAVGVNFHDINGVGLGYSDLSYCQTPPSTNDNTWRARISSQAVTAPATAATATFVLAAHTHTAGSIWADNVEVRMQQDNLLIADAAITDAKIGTVSANKIIAGTMSAGVIISGSIGTASSGQRCVMDGTGFHAYDSSGNLVFDVNDFSQVLTLGQTGGGPRIQMDMSGAFPTMRFYDTSNVNNSFMNVINADSNTAAFGINGGEFTSGSRTLRGRMLLWGPSTGAKLQIMDSATQVQDGGLLELLPDTATHGIFVNGATHGGQTIFSSDSVNSDAIVEIDGYWDGVIRTQNASQLFSAIGLAPAGGVNAVYGPTMFSTVRPIAQYSCSTLGVTGGNVNGTSSTGFLYTLSASSPAAWSVLAWLVRTR
jgi:hypothetical protein